MSDKSDITGGAAVRHSTLCEAFQATAARVPDRVALRTPGGAASVSWGEYAAEVKRTAGALAALELLDDPAFDVLISGTSRFAELPDVMVELAAGTLPALCHTITYDEV